MNKNATIEAKRHYKMYKAGSRWMTAAIITFGTSLVVLGGTATQSVSADTKTPTADKTTQPVNQAQTQTATSTASSQATTADAKDKTAETQPTTTTTTKQVTAQSQAAPSTATKLNHRQAQRTRRNRQQQLKFKPVRRHLVPTRNQLLTPPQPKAQHPRHHLLQRNRPHRLAMLQPRTPPRPNLRPQPQPIQDRPTKTL